MVQSVAVGKKDVITQKIERGLEWAAAHVQQVALALAAMAVIALLTVYVLHNLRKLRHLAWEQLSSAQALASRGQRDEALRIVRELISTSRSAPLTTQAHLFQGDILILQGETQPAIQSYEEALRQAPIPELEALALAGLALSYEQAQDWRKAEELHQRFIKEFPEHFLTARHYEALGRLQMVQEKWGEAQATLERLVTLYPTTVWARNAQDYLFQVRSRLPAKSPPSDEKTP